MRPRAPALALLGSLAILPSQAATYDPDLTWRTLTTEHFHVHFHQGLEAVADAFTVEVEAIYEERVETMAWAPRARTHVVLIDRTDVANGFAGSVPYNAITLFITAPTEESTLADHEDWTTAIQTHEFTHTLHIDTNHGIVRAARYAVGRIASTNGLSPVWLIEGLATWEETRQTNGGRGRTPYVEMILRTAALEDDWPALGRMDGYQALPPAGQIRYLFGQDFVGWVAERHGEKVWTRWAHRYGSGLPYLLPARKVFGRSLRAMHRDWSLERRIRAFDTLRTLEERAPLTEGRAISEPTSSCTAPTFAPTGDKLVFSCRDPREGTQIWLADGDGSNPRKILQDRGARTFAWRGDGEAFFYAGLHVVNRFNTFSDLYLHTLGGGDAAALTQGARARDPHVSPDGSRIVMVTNGRQRNQLEVLTVDRQRRVLAAFPDDTQLSTPRFSPDGRFLAVSVWQDGRRDLWLFTADGRPHRRLTFDDAIDRDPRFSADGRTLWFASDRSGIPNVYAIDLEEDRLWQVSHVATGAVAPSPHPDGTRVAWQVWHSRGWQVEVHDIDRSTWIDRGPLPVDVREGRWPDPRVDILEPRGAVTPIADPVPTPDAGPDAGPDPDPGEAPGRRARRGFIPVDPLGDTLPGRPALAGPPRTPGRLPQAHRAHLDGGARQSTGGIDSFDQAEVDGVFGEERQDYPFRIAPRRYTPLGPLLPRYWVPFVQTTPFPSRKPLGALPFGLFLSGSTGSVDPVRHYAWSAGLNVRTDANFVGGSASFTLNRWIPVYSLSFRRSADTPTRYVIPDPDEPTAPDGSTNAVFSDERYWQKTHTLTAAVDYPYTFRTWIFARYQIRFQQPLDPLPEGALPDFLPLRGALATVQGGWRYAWSQPTPTSISREDARIVSVVGGVVHPWLGAFAREPDGSTTGISAVQLTAELREYRVMPFAPNHVLAFRAAAGASFGQDRFLGLYQLGGNFGDTAFYVTPTSSRMLRGYDIGAAVGDVFWLGGLEYRLPIVRIDHGVHTWPAFFRAVSANAFLDVGNAFSDPTRWRDAVDGTLVGVGAELRLQTILWYGVPATARVGMGMGLTGQDPIRPLRRPADGRRVLDPRLFYARVGGSF